ncbi:tetratricopeptide repeat protein [Draconibacterium sp. IB214405]|uniref:tetratricopeptide repeat protein n=1 Tax=Draconibacterium sp. IB214405 TaxID=3097352 RepID=UPI002A0F036B|nr:tetratricopeptide repeat protein [Draconibacterium sp. IB214405]MDX8341756.1 tetratricopeptide repeat protein [Draconibacterium sp. IB214405]
MKGPYYITIICLLLLTSYVKAQTKPNYDEIIAYASQELNEDSILNSFAFKLRAKAYYSKGNKTIAIKDYNSYINLNKEDWEAYYERGVIRKELEDYHGALIDFEKSLKNTPNLSNIYFAIGETYQSIDTPTKALEFYKKAILHDEANSKAYNNIGLIYLEKCKYEEAINYFSKAINSNSVQLNCLFNRGYAYMQMESLAKAENDLNRAYKLSPDNGYVNYYLGLLNQKKGNQEIALKYFNKALEKGISKNTFKK